jgi:hypothetical protein
MSADLSEFDAAAAASARGPRCTLCILLDPAHENLAPERITSLQAALATDYRGGGYSHATIAKVLETWGTKISGDTIGRHRRGLCRP